jgi:hypothetical protein
MKNQTFITLALLSIFLLAACGAQTTTKSTEAATPDELAIPDEMTVPDEIATPGVTAAPDPCSEANLPDEVTKINDLMSEFDDYSGLASSTQQNQLVQVIPPLQEVRRRAQSQKAPECLMNLKSLQINHMNTVIEILLVFMSDAEAENVSEGIAQASELHNQYDLEIARLLGLTVIAPVTLATGTPVANVTPISADQPSWLFISNLGPDGATLRETPDLDTEGVATLEAGLITAAFGQTPDGLWIQVEVPGQPGQKAWVLASLVQIVVQLPVVTP